MSSNSSEDSDFAKFAAVAVTGDDISASAEKSKQDAKKREMKAAQRRAGLLSGGGVLGSSKEDQNGEDGTQDDGFLDAIQLRVADALKQRLDKEVSWAEHSTNKEGQVRDRERNNEDNTLKKEQQEDDEDDNNGVSLFKNAPKIKNIVGMWLGVPTSGTVPMSPSVQAPQRQRAPHLKRRHITDDEDFPEEDINAKNKRKKKTIEWNLVAVDGNALIEMAKAEAEKVKDKVVPVTLVDPGSSEEEAGGRAKQRRRRKDNEAAALLFAANPVGKVRSR